MEQERPGFSAEQRPSNDNRKSQTSEPDTKMAPPPPGRQTVRQRWNAVQLSKMAIFWICLAMIAGTMLVGFTWGGWVTEGTSQKTAVTLANDAVVQRLSAICIAQFQQDPAKAEKLVELKEASSYQQRSYVEEQGWATMPGDEQSDNKVVAECAKQLAQID